MKKKLDEIQKRFEMVLNKYKVKNKELSDENKKLR